MKRRRASGRRVRGRRTKRRRFKARARRLRGLNGSMLLQRKFYLTTWFPNTTTTDGFWRYQTFKFQDCPSYTEISNLFDRVKINRIKVEYMPKYDSFAGNDTVDQTLPGLTNQWGSNVHTIMDADSTVVPTGTYNSTFNSFCENGHVTTRNGKNKFKIYFKPKVNYDVQGAAVTRKFAPYVSTQDNTPTYYGYHIYVQDNNFSATGLAGQAYDIFVTYYMSCKNTR